MPNDADAMRFRDSLETLNRKNLFDTYSDSIRTSIQRGARVLLIDKPHMIETWGSVSNGLVFYHNVMVRVSKELGVKFIIQTDVSEQKFSVYWEEIPAIQKS